MEDIDKLSNDICNACHTRHKCENQCCTMADIVAEELYTIGYRQLTDYAIKVLRQARELKYEACKETAKEIFKKLIKTAENFDGYLPLGVLKAWAIEYEVEVEK